MATFNGFNINDGANYIIHQIEHRGMPVRDLDTAKITGRPGVKLLSDEFAEKKIRARGSVIGSSASDLQSKIDNLHKNITRVVEKTLTIDSGRDYKATVNNLIVGDPKYANNYVPFEIEFLCSDPFAYGASQTVSQTVASGVSSLQETVSISGTVFAEPTITFTSTGSNGSTTTSGIIINHAPTGDQVTWSGTTTNLTLGYGDYVAFNYKSQSLTTSGVTHDYGGSLLTRWEPGSNQFTTTFSGMTQGGTLDFQYQPRYIS